MTKVGLVRGDPTFIAPKIWHIVAFYRYVALYSALDFFIQHSAYAPQHH